MATDLMVTPAPVVPLDARSGGINAAPSGLPVEGAAGARFPTRHGMARLLPIRNGADGRLVFVIDSFYGTRMAGHHAVLSGEGPRPLLSAATALPAGIEDRIRAAYTTARH